MTTSPDRTETLKSSGIAGAWAVLPARVAAWTCAALINAPVLYHVARGSRAYLGFFADDFFYYFVIAGNLLSRGRLTFDGIHSTNGFHPLWLGILTLLRFVTGGSEPAFYVCLALLNVVLAIATFELYARLGCALGARPVVAFVAAAALALPINVAFVEGMETNIAIPLCAALLLAVASGRAMTPGRAAAIGLLASLTVLARLDLAILVGMILVAQIWRARRSLATSFVAAARTALAFGAGGILLPLYLACNQIAFGSPIPTSASAKQMTTSVGINVPFLQEVLDLQVAPLAAVVAPVGLVLLFTRWSPVRTSRARIAAAAALAFPFVYYVAYALRSSWCCFPWYGYALFAGSYVGVILLAEVVAAHMPRTALVWAAALVSLVVLARVPVTGLRYLARHTQGWTIEDNSLTANAFWLADAMRDHPGVYAMGDKAGNVANLVNDPLVQLEGLVSDHAMLDHIQREDPLGQVLHDYGVDYLIVSVEPDAEPPQRDGCLEVSQPNPHEAGDRSPKMRGRMCATPIEDHLIASGAHSWSKYKISVHTYVFDVRGI